MYGQGFTPNGQEPHSASRRQKRPTVSPYGNRTVNKPPIFAWLKRLNWVKMYAIFIGTILTIGAIVVGNTFKAQGEYTWQMVFNWGLFIACEVAASIIVAFFLALGSVIEKQKAIISALNEEGN